jgi:hypothetical protein
LRTCSARVQLGQAAIEVLELVDQERLVAQLRRLRDLRGGSECVPQQQHDGRVVQARLGVREGLPKQGHGGAAQA